MHLIRGVRTLSVTVLNSYTDADLTQPAEAAKLEYQNEITVLHFIRDA